MTKDSDRVLIAGGGPVGLLCAWLLGRRGLPVRLFDDNAGPQDDPRAATTHPATLEVLAEAGLAEDMARVGLVAPIFQFWDRPSGERWRNSTTRSAQGRHTLPLCHPMRAVQDRAI